MRYALAAVALGVLGQEQHGQQVAVVLAAGPALLDELHARHRVLTERGVAIRTGVLANLRLDRDRPL